MQRSNRGSARRALVVTLALALVLAAGGYYLLGSKRERAPLPAAAAVAPPRVDPLPEAPAPPARRAAPEVSERATARMALDPREEPTPASHPTCVVLGRLADEGDAPIAGARVRLYAYGEWAEGHEVPRLAGRYDLRGFETRTDEAGAFRIEAPVPTSEAPALAIEPDPHHDSRTFRFGTHGAANQPPLTAGVRDLGVVRVARTGAIRGRVGDAGGEAVADAKVVIGPGRSQTYGRDTWTDDAGRYLVAHAPVGTYLLKVDKEGFLAASQEVTVERGSDTSAVDLLLERSPTIEGRVVDATGAPVAGARLWGWPSTHGKGTGATSGADGRFVVHLPQDEPYTLAAELDGHLRWGEENDKTRTFAPGTRELRVELRTMPRTRFLVVDGASDEPIERFGLAILDDNGSEAPIRVYTERRLPRIDEHEGGIALATARPGIDAFVVAAPGYLLESGDIVHEALDTPRQTIRMHRAPAVRGRVLRTGEPLAGAPVELESGRMEGGGGEGDGARFLSDSRARSSAVTDAEGRFELASQWAGVHRLRVRAAGLAPIAVAPLLLRPAEEIDVGDLEPPAGATLHGQVLVPAGVEPAGLAVFVDDARAGAATLTGAGGGFRLEQVAPGARALILGGRPSELASGARAELDVLAGGTHAVTIDATKHGMCRVALEIELGGIDPEGFQVDLCPPQGRAESLGNCDGSGRVSGSVRAWGEAIVRLWLPGLGRIEHPRPLELRHGEDLDELVRFELARLRIVLPAGVPLPSEGSARLSLADGGRGQQASLRFAGGSHALGDPRLATAEGGTLWIGCLLPGAFDLTLELDTLAAGSREIVRSGREVFYRAERSLTLVAGEELRLELD